MIVVHAFKDFPTYIYGPKEIENLIDDLNRDGIPNAVHSAFGFIDFVRGYADGVYDVYEHPMMQFYIGGLENSGVIKVYDGWVKM